MEILLLTGLILLNGAFAMSEIALVTARRARLARLAEEGDAGAAAAVTLHDDPTRFLSTVQVGITSIGILNGIIGEAVLAEPLSAWLRSLGVDSEASRIGATALVVVVITYLSIVVGELVPKRLGQFNPEGVARRVARPMRLLAAAAQPFVRLLSASTDTILRLLGRQESSEAGVIEEEIHALLEEGSETGAIEQQEREMVRNVFRLDARPINSLMTPRADIVYLDTTRPLDDNLRRVAESEHSRFPVCKGSLDDVLGIVTAKQLLDQTLRGGRPDLAAQRMPAVFVPESLTGMDLLEQFRASDAHLVLVIDEYGEINGLVTLQDVLEAVTGEFTPRNLEDAWAVPREDGSWLLDGLIPLPELKDRLGLRHVPDEDRGRYHTLSGLVMWLSGRLPQTGDVLTWEHWRLEVVDLDGKRIDKVLATPLPPEAAPSAAPDSVDAN
ncbi:hemolysin family protein [Thiobacillus sedimenti]|uniref:Hemolysin family protein n=1 Tax=Thiobacillus sedimenti TaxID=3110231 RepID=A0ABZ1CHB6_9PROT|nr:hemolysin family protein [Thiobacillus sp. SCUT-2]WRS38777.1 hemolysin family protein [Thiobacillus sp. SCUT-2]